MNVSALIVISLMGSLCCALISAISAYLMPQYPLLWEISLGLAAALFVAYLVLDRKSLGQLFSKKTTRYGLNVGVMSLFALGIVVFLNLIANDHDWKKDLTKNKLHTLSDESAKVLASIKQDIRIRAFVDARVRNEFDNFFSKYSYVSKNVHFEHIDLDKDPMVLEKYKIKNAGVLIVESETRTARVDNLSGPDDPKLEEKLTNALIQVTKGDKKKIYFVSGHGEKLITDTGPKGYSDMKDTLEAGRYNVEELVTVQKEKIPSDAEILILAGPVSDFMEYELNSFDEFLKRGGKILFLLEPETNAKVQGFLAKYGVSWKAKKTILEQNPAQLRAGGSPLVPIVVSYNRTQEIVKDAQQVSIFPISTPVEKSPKAPPEYKVDSLFSTSKLSLEVEMFAENKLKVDQKNDRRGPLSLGVAVSGPAVNKVIDAKEKAEQKPDAPKAEFRLVVIGDSDFASNGVVKTGINRDIFQNSLSWLAQEEDLISIRPRTSDERYFNIDGVRTRVITFTAGVFLPLSMLVSGLLVWFTRKRK